MWSDIVSVLGILRPGAVRCRDRFAGVDPMLGVFDKDDQEAIPCG